MHSRSLRMALCITTLCGLVLVGLPASVVVVEAVSGFAIPGGASVAEAGRGKKPRGTTRVCTTATTNKAGKKKSKKTCRRVAMFSGHAAAKATLRDEPLSRPSGNIAVTSDNLREQVQVNIYSEDGSFNDGALAKLDEVFRCKRTGETRAVDPRLYEMLSRIYDRFGSKTIELVSGFRFYERASSRHFHASAMDIRIPGVSLGDLHSYAVSLDPGGMGIGIYPNAGFIHFDYRAPGDPSYRWTDRSGSGSSAKGKRKTTRTKPARRPTS